MNDARTVARRAIEAASEEWAREDFYENDEVNPLIVKHVQNLTDDPFTRADALDMIRFHIEMMRSLS